MILSALLASFCSIRLLSQSPKDPFFLGCNFIYEGHRRLKLIFNISLFNRSRRTKSIPELNKILNLLLGVVEKTENGRQHVLKHDGEKILQTFRANFHAQLLSQILGLILPNTSPSDISVVQSLDDYDRSCSNVSSISSGSISTDPTPADLVANRSVPPYLLKSSLSGNGTFERIYSPVTRTYFNKKVTFNENIR